MALGKLGLILLVADIITGIVLGKNVLNFLGKRDDDQGDVKEGWKEKVANEIMEKVKEKQAAANGAADKDREQKQ